MVRGGQLVFLVLVFSACYLPTSRHCYILIGATSCPFCSVVLSPTMMASLLFGTPGFETRLSRAGPFYLYLPRRSLSWSRGQTGLDRFHAQQQHQMNRLILIPLNTYDNTLAKHHKYKHTHKFPLIIHRLPPSPRLTRKSSLTSLNNPPRHILPTPIRPRHRPQCHKRRRMFPRQPYPLLRHAGPHLKNVLVALLQPSLKVAVAPVARQLVVEPVRRNVRRGMAVGVVFSVGG